MSHVLLWPMPQKQTTKQYSFLMPHFFACLQCIKISSPISFFVDSQTPQHSATTLNAAGHNVSSSGVCLQNENAVNESSENTDGKFQNQSGQSSVAKAQPSFFNHSLFIWFDQFVHWGHEKSLLSNCDDHAWNLDEENR